MLTASLCCLFNINCSANADAQPNSAGEPVISANESATVPGNMSTTATPAQHSSFAKKIIGVVTGVVVGAPVCAVRKPLDEDKYAIADLTGNSKKGRAVIPTAVLWAPFACVEGILEAPFFAINNSLVNYDKPFSKEQFSLVKPAASIKEEEKLPTPRPGDVR